MKPFVVLLVAIFSVCVLGQTPSTPTWPLSFSASVFVHGPNNDNPKFARWFFDYNNSRERFDSIGEFNGQIVISETFFLGSSPSVGILYNVYYIGDSVICFSNNTSNYSMPNPNFTNFKFVGNPVINYIETNLWVAPESQNSYYMYYESSSSREPVEFDWVDHKGNPKTYRFFEFDEAIQDDSIFTISPLVLANCN
eukprot:TRINITY_DN11978_c0_g1_i1.p1 TRINITY_DN11978_c0_g1~~TRINITY_DN11978_c0_g1_i1.p1  ORF type:complete len:196 (-),score=32.81 TRINITY_DN11978_c0_g1_i1:46-633(-)